METAPTATPPSTTERANGLATYFAVLTSPKAAFEQLRRTPMWGWAALLTLAIVIVAAFLLHPATVHSTQVFDQQMIGHVSADQKAQVEARINQQNQNALWRPLVNSVVGIFVSWLVVALVALLAASAGGGDARFKPAWVTAVNASFPGVLGQLVNALIIYIRGPLSVNSFADLNALPSLAPLGGSNAVLSAFLGTINPFQIWYFIVLTIGIQSVLGTKRAPAITASVIVWFLGGLLFAALAAVTNMFAK